MEYFVISAKFVLLKYYTLSSQLQRLTSFSVGCSGRRILSPGQIAVMRKRSIGLSILLPNTHLSNNIFEVAFSPCICRMCHHGYYSVIILLVLVVEEHQLSPQMSLLGCTKYLSQSDKDNQWKFIRNNEYEGCSGSIEGVGKMTLKGHQTAPPQWHNFLLIFIFRLSTRWTEQVSTTL